MLSITYDPRVADMSSSIKKHYNFAKRDPNFVKVFPEIPMIGFKRAREHLIRAKLYPVEKYNFRDRLGFSKCSKKDIGCSLCSKRENTSKHVFLSEKKYIQSNHKFHVKILMLFIPLNVRKVIYNMLARQFNQFMKDF